jgi:hypothetical protein
MFHFSWYFQKIYDTKLLTCDMFLHLSQSSLILVIIGHLDGRVVFLLDAFILFFYNTNG